MPVFICFVCICPSNKITSFSADDLFIGECWKWYLVFLSTVRSLLEYRNSDIYVKV